MRRTLVVVLLALWALIGLPGTAQAGGPTSVLITNPSTGEAGAFYYTSQEYADLERFLTTQPTSDHRAARRLRSHAVHGDVADPRRAAVAPRHGVPRRLRGSLRDDEAGQR